MMKLEKFYQKLSEIPEAPDLFSNIDKKISRRKTGRNITMSILAIFIISVFIMNPLNFNGNIQNEQIMPSVAAIEEELPQDILDVIQSINDYFNDTTFEYSLLDMYTYME